LVSIKRAIRVISLNQTNVDSKCSLIFIHCLLVTQTSYIETNPGPNPRYPCGTCQKEITWNDKGILCDACNTWYHCNCQGLGDTAYDFLSNFSFSCFCISCGSHNHSTSLAESLDTLGSKSFFTPLENAPLNTLLLKAVQWGMIDTMFNQKRGLLLKWIKLKRLNLLNWNRKNN